jgi:cytochrome P450
MNTAAEPIAHHDPEPVVAHDGPSGCPVLHNFDILGEAEVNRPGTYTAVAREEAPVFFVPEVGQYVVTRWDDAHRALTDHKLFAPLQTPYTKVPAEAAELLPNGFAYGRASALSVLSPPAHTRVRKLAQKAFTRSAALAKAEEIRGICQELIDGFVADGSCDLSPPSLPSTRSGRSARSSGSSTSWRRRSTNGQWTSSPCAATQGCRTTR